MPPVSTPHSNQRTPHSNQRLNTDQPVPDYSFLNEKPKRSFQMPSLNLKGSSFIKRIVVTSVAFIALVILIIVIKNLLTTQPFNKTDYLLVAERQQQMLHILNHDLSDTSRLSTVNQDLVATATLSLQTDQHATLTLLSEAGDKVNSSALSGILSSSIDSQISSALAANNINPVFESIMNTQLSDYMSDLSTAFNSTNISVGKTLIRSEYRQAKLLQKALSSTNS